MLCALSETRLARPGWRPERARRRRRRAPPGRVPACERGSADVRGAAPARGPVRPLHAPTELLILIREICNTSLLPDNF